MLQVRSDGCKYKDKLYAVGEQIPMSDPCAICTCTFSGEIACTFSECPGDAFGVPPYPSNATQQEITVGKYKNCYYYHSLDKCCGLPKCPSDDELNKSPKCVYAQKMYNLGDKIYPTEDKCKTCVCSANWNANTFLSSSSCRTIECDLNKKLLARGCVPVYHESHCCPIEYKCPPPTAEERKQLCALNPDVGPCTALLQRYFFNDTSKACELFMYGGCAGNENNFETLNECQQFCTQFPPVTPATDMNKCNFGETSYSIGHKLIFDKCVECTCVVPPDYTCIHKC
ncbi:hypothetical protein B4U80_09612 [Leptotrombidium deliense]|uniref:BPTI/Kunitz inhibitor domain-containing protein n=1 Tax=Leptotrombidium deliense TaxID=299467 RepID=A0A443SLX2_9ACAR|nr:hypothetical protein B4U80_09612 [Leptotrombidium deliense]